MTIQDPSKSSSRKIRVRQFWLQPTPSFPDPPQRESYLDEASYLKAEQRYEAEWRIEYACDGCADRSCPQCGQIDARA